MRVETVTLLAVLVGSGLAGVARGDDDNAKGSDAQHNRRAPAMRIRMPGKSHHGKLPQLTAVQAQQRDRLRKDLEKLAGEIGERNTQHPQEFALAAQWIERSMVAAGYRVARQNYQVQGRTCVNLQAEITGSDQPDKIIVVGAHYDSVAGTAGANDNGTGVVALLALARSLATDRPARTLRFVFFANEEPPYFQTKSMGSYVYAKRCRAQKENILGMLSLETIGYFSDEKDSQHYPPPFNLFYPSTGNFIAFVGNTESGDLVSNCVATFRESVKFPSEGAAVPGEIEGVGWSDHWSFWQFGYSALMVTDTAPFRYPHYHLKSDTPDKIHYDRLVRVVNGLDGVIRALTSPKLAESAPAQQQDAG